MHVNIHHTHTHEQHTDTNRYLPYIHKLTYITHTHMNNIPLQTGICHTYRDMTCINIHTYQPYKYGYIHTRTHISLPTSHTHT